MKYFIMAFFSSLLASNATSQDSTITLSQYEIFTAQANKILKTETKEAGSSISRPVTVFKTTDLISGSSIHAVRIGYFNTSEMPAMNNTSALYIDFEHLDSVIYALTFLLTEMGKPKPATNLRLSYTTPTDITFSCFYDITYETWRIQIGKLYKYSHTYIPNTLLTYPNKKRFIELIEDLKSAKSMAMAL